MILEEAATALHTFVKEKYQYGMPSRSFKDFGSTNAAACAIIRKRGLKRVSKDFPHLFIWEGCQGGEEKLRAIHKANFGARLSNHRVATVATQFYDQMLKNDHNRRRLCEDRSRFDTEFASWKDRERQRGRNLVGISPSAILMALRRTNIIESVADEMYVIIWKEEASMCVPETREDRVREAVSRVSLARKDLEKNRHGIEVDAIAFENEPVGVQLEQTVFIRNKSYPGDVSINIDSTLAERKGVQVIGPKNVTLSEGESHKISVRYKSTVIGCMRCIIIVNVSSDDIQEFGIVRYISIRTGDPQDDHILKPTSPYQRKARGKDGKKFSNPDRLERPEKTELAKFVNPLKKYGIPDYWYNATSAKTCENHFIELYSKGDDVPEDEMDYPSVSSFHEKLNMSNFSDIFHRLLWAEEAQMKVDIKNYDMVGAPLVKEGNNYKLAVPGLAESRPSVLRGDFITMSLQNNKSFFAQVTRVELETVILKLPVSFEQYFLKGLKVDVRFGFKRMPLRTAHQALDAVREGDPLIDHILFPEAIEEVGETASALTRLNERVRSPDDLVLFNRDLNPEQRAAVFGIVSSVSRPRPFLLYGPPGTGKTVTLVEAILQTIRAKGADPSSRILVCAPSNAASDLLVQRLSSCVEPSEMIRIIAYSRDKETVPSDVLKYASYSTAEQSFVMPPLDIVREKRIVVITLSSAGKLPNEGLIGHFTHVYIDEAGHAIEPEALCFVQLLKKTNLNPPVVVVAGDPQQLGPIVRSELAKAFGLEMSFLERLSKRKAYKRLTDAEGEIKFDQRIVTKLIRNYRSHKAIMKLPNELFYDNDLLPCANPILSSLQNWEHLPMKGFPVIFHGVEGVDEREGSSPSWFNAEEASIVKYYVNLLVNATRNNKCDPKEIGIVTPYHKQVQKIRILLNKYGFGESKVGSVDEFQGSERRVIIISTVRSTVEYIDDDHKHRLGFLANSKRFNVAITRAQALLIVVGNPNVLAHDDNWRRFIEYCQQNGGYDGCSFDSKDIDARKVSRGNTDSFLDESVTSLALMKIDGDGLGRSDDEEEFIMVEDTAWRSEE